MSHDIESVESLLIQIGEPRLSRLGIAVTPSSGELPEHRLYKLLAIENPDSAHSGYNALIRRLVSYERAAEHENSRRLSEDLQTLGE